MNRLRLLITVLLSAAASAVSQPAKLVMVTEVWAPYRMNDPASVSGFRGIDIDLMTALETRLGIPIEIRRVPWARALEMMREGQADLITGIARTEERAEYMKYIPTSYSAVRPMFFTQKGKGTTVRSYEDLLGKSIGMSLHSSYFARFNADTTLNKVGLSTEEQILKMLALGRIDLAIGTDPNLSWDIARLGFRDTLEPTAWQPADTTPLYFAVSLKSSAVDLVERIDGIVRAMLSDGSIARITAAYR